MSSWHSYPKVWAIGHAYAKELFDDYVIIEEKIDGSQFSFGVFGGELRCRSKGKELILDAPEKMFIPAIETARELMPLLTPGWTYRGEYLRTPKHNCLTYDRTPKKNIIIFDINSDNEAYCGWEFKREEATRIGLECVPVLYRGTVDGPEKLMELMKTESCLGGQKIEGFVVKNYHRFGPDKKVLMGKHVCEEFKEKQKIDWKEQNPGRMDVVHALITAYRQPARWDKAIQHLREAGKLEGSPRDIGALIREAQRDLEEECAQEIKDALYKWAIPQIVRASTGGLPEYYKQKLLEQQFASER